MKYCKDCKWCAFPEYVVENDNESMDSCAQCNHPKNIIKKIEESYVTGGNIDRSYRRGICCGLRVYNGTEDDRFCGVDARWFEPKE